MSKSVGESKNYLNNKITLLNGKDKRCIYFAWIYFVGF